MGKVEAQDEGGADAEAARLALLFERVKAREALSLSPVSLGRCSFSMDIFRFQELYQDVPEFVGEDEGDDKPIYDPVWLWTPEAEARLVDGKLACKLVVVALHRFAAAAADLRFAEKELLGSLMLPEVPLSITVQHSTRDNLCLLYSTPSCLLLVCQYPVSGERANAWRKALFSNVTPQRVVVLDTVTTEQYKRTDGSPVHAPLLRKLQTSTQPGLDELCPYLEVPNILTKAPASILTHCEIHQIPASAFVSFVDMPEPRVESLLAFDPVFSHVSAPAASPSVLNAYRRLISSTPLSAAATIFL